MGEEDNPFAGVIGGEVDLALGRDGSEGRGRVTDARHAGDGGGVSVVVIAGPFLEWFVQHPIFPMGIPLCLPACPAMVEQRSRALVLSSRRPAD